MKNHILSASRLTLVMLVIVGIYLGIVYAGSKVLPTQGNAEIINFKGQKFYANIGQNFTSPKYFHGRPSAVDYNAAGSAGSNKGPSNEEYLQTVQKRIDTLKMMNPEMQNAKVPVELVTASGSGLDRTFLRKARFIRLKEWQKTEISVQKNWNNLSKIKQKHLFSVRQK
jgi:K+-transporting ATPase ATPase C chain